MSDEKYTISLYRLEQYLMASDRGNLKFEKKIPSFSVESEANGKYVSPTFSSREEDGVRKGRLPKVILISAAGATGKSELTKYLSVTFGIPVFDLALHTPVGSNSLTGLFFETLGAQGLASYVNDLEQGRAIMMIDALDEGLLKTTIGAFNAFLDDITAIARKSTSTPFILLGRTNAIEYSTIYFWEKGARAEMLHIEPFTEGQAREFIDKQIGETNYAQQYRVVRDYIIASVQGFFRNEPAMRRDDSKAFIGYAPVLLSIAVLLRKTSNFMALYEELLAKEDRGVKLVLEIVALILKRDRDQKILPIIQDRLLKDRSPDFAELVVKNIYTDQEQCVRILHFVLSERPDIRVSDDTLFNLQYEEMAEEWLTEHPFIQNRKIQNVVFESYVIAKLMQVAGYEEKVLRYLNTQYKDSFMLFFIFASLSDDKLINSIYLPYLFNSLKSLDGKNDFYGMDIEAEGDYEEDQGEAGCRVEFFNTADPSFRYEFVTSMPPDTVLTFHQQLSNVEIDAPVTIAFKGKRLEFGSPLAISCSRILLDANELVFESKSDGYIVFECDKFEVDYSSGQVPQIINYGAGHSQPSILCDKKPSYPFSEYYQEAAEALSGLSDDTMERYLRLRKILMQFRSHSKGELAKLKDKIEHPRIMKNDLGRKVLEKLLNTGVIFADAHLYKINNDALDKYLKLSYLDLKRKLINSTAIEFLEDI